ncbi:hypothetical protein BDB01DRAFT_846280 [Pilobolus umbonatus]|nr:hypothetical protein BDB01DRAFT_846280 [Pilobolus umbonatus]
MTHIYSKHSTSTVDEEDDDQPSFQLVQPNDSSGALPSWANINSQTEKLVTGPSGNKILCDSPISSAELPPYAAPDDISVQNLPPATQPIQPPPERKKEASHSYERVKPRRTIGDYTLINTLGSGSMGKVRLAVHNITGDKLAVKIVSRRQLKDKHKSKEHNKKTEDDNREIRTIREASIMLLLNHPFIVSVKEMLILDPYYYLFMEYVNGGQLLDYIISHGKLKEKQARRFTRQIVSALDYCHRNSIVHRDLKIENILISEAGNIKIIDFGLSNLYSPRSQLKTFCGSLYFAAPELLNAKEYVGPEVDVWSLGVVLYVLVCGKVPFDDQNIHALHDKIMRGIVDYPPHLSSDCKSILSRMLVTNPAHRATISEIIIHPWLNKGYDGPVDNFLPDRAPLTLPIDMEVVKGMSGFEFGTEEEVKNKLEAIITSDEYQNAAKILARRTAETNRHRHSTHIISKFSSHTLASKKAFILGNDDPESIPAAYHPLVSIYHLVKERMERESSPEESFDSSVLKSSRRVMTNSPPEGHSPPPPSQTDHMGEHKEHVIEGVAYNKRGKVHIQVNEEEHIETNKMNGLSRLFSKGLAHNPRLAHSHKRTEDDEDGQELSHTGTRDSNVLQRLTHVITGNSIDKDDSKKAQKSKLYEDAISQSTSTPLKTNSGNSGDKLSKSYAPPSHFPHNIFQQGTSTQKMEVANDEKTMESSSSSFGNKLTKILPRRMTLGQTSMSNAENHNNFLNLVNNSEKGSTPSKRHSKVEMTVKLNLKKLPSHGVFSSDNRTKQHNHEQSFPSTIDGPSNFQKGTADENIKPVFLKGLFSVTTTSTKHPSVIRSDLIRVLERIGVKWRESKGRFECVHVPSIDMNKVVDGKEHYGRQHPSFSSEDGVETNNNTSPTVPVPDLIVRFEIYIVKVPWLLGMHGLQFRRLGGDPWQYKNMCSKILVELKL